MVRTWNSSNDFTAELQCSLRSLTGLDDQMMQLYHGVSQMKILARNSATIRKILNLSSLEETIREVATNAKWRLRRKVCVAT